MKFTPNEAIAFAEQGHLVRWIERFLKTSGNNSALWEGLCLAQRWWQPPHKMYLSQLTRVVGPEAHMEYMQDRANFATRIQSMTTSLADGWQPPPLIVEYRGLDNLSIRDGNHRYVALKQTKYKDYWIITWFNSETDYEAYRSHFNLT